MRSQDILSVFHYPPLHLSAMGRRLGGWDGQCPVTETVSEQLFRLPILLGLSEDDQSRVINSFAGSNSRASGHVHQIGEVLSTERAGELPMAARWTAHNVLTVHPAGLLIGCYTSTSDNENYNRFPSHVPYLYFEPAGRFCGSYPSGPPVAPTIEHRETRHGATVVDNYYWLRDKTNPEVINTWRPRTLTRRL